jgi:hypothetical protein
MGRFHVVGVKSLPRFGRGRPAVREPARPGCGPCPAEDSELALSEDSVSSATVDSRVDGDSETESSVVHGGGGGGEPRPAELERPDGGWIMRLVRWLGERLRRRRNPFTIAVPRLSSTVVPRQGCLKLEGVQVVRNDLSDTDFEVVPTRRARTATPETTESVACEFRASSSDSTESAELRVGNL